MPSSLSILLFFLGLLACLFRDGSSVPVCITKAHGTCEGGVLENCLFRNASAENPVQPACGRSWKGWAWPTRWVITNIGRARYLCIPKAGSMSIRAGMAKFHEVYPDGMRSRPGKDTGRLSPMGPFAKTEHLLAGNASRYLSFTFVAEPIQHLIGGFLETPRFVSVELMRRFLTQWICLGSLRPLLPPNTRIPGMKCDVHRTPQLLILENAAAEAQQLFHRGLRDTPSPFDFVGHLESVSSEWDLLRAMIQQKSGAQLPALPHTNNKSPRRVVLGLYGNVATMPRGYARGLCAVLKSEYTCLGYQFPRQCTDEGGRFDVTVDEVQAFCSSESAFLFSPSGQP